MNTDPRIQGLLERISRRTRCGSGGKCDRFGATIASILACSWLRMSTNLLWGSIVKHPGCVFPRCFWNEGSVQRLVGR